MNKNLIETVESLGGTALMSGILIQFSDTTFVDAVKKIYEMGVEAEREACAKVCEDSVEYAGDTLAQAIRARGQG
jgi:hypothetical protein